MKRTKLTRRIVAMATALSIVAGLRAADEAVRPGQRPIPEELREQLKNLSPEERQARLREFREKHPEGPVREEMERRREEFKKLSTEERKAKLKEARANRGERPLLQDVSPEEREAKRKELKARFEKHRTDLLKKKEDGTLTPQEARRLQHFEELAKRFEQGGRRPGLRPFPPPDLPQKRTDGSAPAN